jgi:hypothetical protein
MVVKKLNHSDPSLFAIFYRGHGYTPAKLDEIYDHFSLKNDHGTKFNRNFHKFNMRKSRTRHTNCKSRNRKVEM